MTDYSAMSDFEINLAVAQQMPSIIGISERQRSLTDAVFYNEVENVKYFDPCNSWADAGPIIQDNGITVACFKNIMATAWDSQKGLAFGAVFKGANPLRAAMIVFLMMKEQQ